MYSWMNELSLARSKCSALVILMPRCLLLFCTHNLSGWTFANLINFSFCAGSEKAGGMPFVTWLVANSTLRRNQTVRQNWHLRSARAIPCWCRSQIQVCDWLSDGVWDWEALVSCHPLWTGSRDATTESNHYGYSPDWIPDDAIRETHVPNSHCPPEIQRCQIGYFLQKMVSLLV